MRRLNSLWQRGLRAAGRVAHRIGAFDAWGRLLAPPRQTLMWHAISDQSIAIDGYRHDLPADVFEAQLAYVARRFELVPYDAPPARGQAVLTFDDGFIDMVTQVLPRLEAHRAPALLFPILSKVGTPGYVDWEDLERLRDSGLVRFGSHTVSHLPGQITDPEEMCREILVPKQVFEERLGVTVDAFCWPGGKVLAEPAILELLQAEFRFSYGGRSRNQHWPPQYRLKRVDAGQLPEPHELAAKLSGMPVLSHLR